MGYYSAIKKKEILPFATAWVDLQSIMRGDPQFLIDMEMRVFVKIH